MLFFTSPFSPWQRQRAQCLLTTAEGGFSDVCDVNTSCVVCVHVCEHITHIRYVKHNTTDRMYTRI
jgi:hypothetical protein